MGGGVYSLRFGVWGLFITETQRSTEGHGGRPLLGGTTNATQVFAWRDDFTPSCGSPLWPSVLLCVLCDEEVRGSGQRYLSLR